MEFLNSDQTLGVGLTDDKGFEPLDQFRLLILVGVTGAGKTTLQKALETEYAFCTLPGRRRLTDKVIIPQMQDNPHLVRDRARRFALTKGYRERHPGGMAHVLSRIKIKRPCTTLILFDGLRGVDEVCFARERFPQALFIVLTAPDSVRIMRLLDRQDTFDRITSSPTEELAQMLETLCPPDQIKILYDFIRQRGIPQSALMEKARIVLKERENYEQEKACEFLTRAARDRTIVVNSAELSPEQVFGRVKAGLTKILSPARIRQ